VSVKRSQSSITRGQKAAYVVTVSTVNGPASDVTVKLTSDPSSQKPTFTKGCAKGNGAGSCTIASVTDKQPATLNAQIPVAANANSVSSVKLTATASIVTTAKWTPPAAAETVSVTAASPSPSGSSPGGSPSGSGNGNGNGNGSSPPAVPAAPLGPVPDLNNVSSSLIGAGNAAGLFPAIDPSATPSPAAGTHPGGNGGNASPVSNSYPLALGTTVVPAQVAGLIALAVALLLTMTRLSARRRPGGPKDANDSKDAKDDAPSAKPGPEDKASTTDKKA
jgi:hypothetical protein